MDTKKAIMCSAASIAVGSLAYFLLKKDPQLQPTVPINPPPVILPSFFNYSMSPGSLHNIPIKC